MINTHGWEYGIFDSYSIPSPAIKNILDRDEDKHEEYIKKLDIPDTMKSALQRYLIDLPSYVLGIDNMLSDIKLEILQPYLNELCVFNNVDIKKYLIKIICTKKNYKKIKKYIPKNIEVKII